MTQIQQNSDALNSRSERRTREGNVQSRTGPAKVFVCKYGRGDV